MATYGNIWPTYGNIKKVQATLRQSLFLQPILFFLGHLQEQLVDSVDTASINPRINLPSKKLLVGG
jgi:hypothetical protein